MARRHVGGLMTTAKALSYRFPNDNVLLHKATDRSFFPRRIHNYTHVYLMCHLPMVITKAWQENLHAATRLDWQLKGSSAEHTTQQMNTCYWINHTACSKCRKSPSRGPSAEFQPGPQCRLASRQRGSGISNSSGKRHGIVPDRTDNVSLYSPPPQCG